MLTQILHASQWCWKHNLKRSSRLLDKINQLLCSADIPGRTKIARNVSFAHGGIGVVINPQSVIGDSCIINAKVTLGNGYPHGGAPTLGNYVYVGAGAFLGGGIFVADNVIIGAKSVLTKSISESGVIIAGVPAKIIRKLTDDELKNLTSWNKK